jgi:hypothetical protein
MLGLSLGIWPTILGRSAPALEPDIFVDSVNGNNSNDGLTLGSALQTLAAAQTAVTNSGDGTVLALVRGSYWREQYTPTVNNLTIMTAGDLGDPMPVIDGADIATGWTEHVDGGSFPDIWQVSWSRSSATTTGSEYLGLWADGVRPRAASSLADLQANGGWMPLSFTTQNTTVYIKSVADPNSSGVVYEITKRHYAFNGHGTTIGTPKSAQTYQGPIELKRCVGHYNVMSQGAGSASKLLLREGNIHHSVSEGNQTDVVMTEHHPSIAPSCVAFYRSVSQGFAPVSTRGLFLLPGGASRPSGASAYYSHGGTGKVDSLTINGSASRGADFVNADTLVMRINGGYAEDAPTRHISFGADTNFIRHFLARDTTASPITDNNNVFFTGAATASDADVENCAAYSLKGGTVTQANTTLRHAYRQCSFVNAVPSIVFTGGGPSVDYCICHGARSYSTFLTSYTGDYNVFYFVGQAAPQFNYNGSTYGTLALFQAASSQDVNSVFLKHADQVSGNGIAFWLGVSSGVNAGPSDGDFRINPAARVYNGAGATLSGVFADGVTPITMAGAQEHWNFNTRSVAAGPPTRWPTLPTTIAEMRTYVEGPASWNFYP